MEGKRKLTDKELAEIMLDAIKSGRITTTKRQEEIRRVSRTKILSDSRYIRLAKLGSQIILIDTEI